jgi:hypothetical protein
LDGVRAGSCFSNPKNCSGFQKELFKDGILEVFLCTVSLAIIQKKTQNLFYSESVFQTFLAMLPQHPAETETPTGQEGKLYVFANKVV